MRLVIGMLISLVALYFLLLWGWQSVQVLASPTYGLEDVWRSQVVFGIGRFIGLDPSGLLQLAAALGATKLVVAALCALHLIDRVHPFISRTPRNEILEVALFIAILVGLVSITPAIWSQNGDLTREILIQIVLALFALMLSMIERRRRSRMAMVA